MTGCPSLIIAGSSTGVGKSSVSLGLMAALCVGNTSVQAFKVGPDFVDPLYHTRATGRPSINLDRWFSSPRGLRELWDKHRKDVDFCIVEGTMGLLDDLKCPLLGEDLLPFSTAQVAKWFDIPVVLVMDGSKLESSIGVLVRGYCTWDRGVRIAGIIFNNVREQDDLSELEAIVNRACPHDIPVLGGIPYDEAPPDGALESAFDSSVIDNKIFNLSSVVSQYVDVKKLVEIARESHAVAPAGRTPSENGVPIERKSKNAKRKARRKKAKLAKTENSTGQEPCGSTSSDQVSSGGHSEEDNGPMAVTRMAVARDNAFCFYYEENLELMRHYGLELVFFSPLTDPLPSNIAAVYLGGGVPELHAAALADNKVFRAGMKKFVESGGIVFAEGGGLLVLCQSLQTRTGFPQQPMVGIFPFRAIMSRTQVIKSYVEVKVGDNCPIFTPGATMKGYICSDSELVQEQHIGGIQSTDEWKSCYQARVFNGKKTAVSDMIDGYTTSSVLGSYVHHYFGSSEEVLKTLVDKCQGVNVAAVTAAVARSRRMADCLEGSVVYTPPLTPLGHRSNLGMLGVHSSPDLCRVRSRPQSMDLNAYDFNTAVESKHMMLPKPQSLGSLCHRTAFAFDNGAYDQRSPGAASPVQLGSAADLNTLVGSRRHLTRMQGSGMAHDADHRQQNGRMSHERYQYRVSNNSESHSVFSSEGSEMMNPLPFGRKKTDVHTAARYPEQGGQFLKEAAHYLDVNPAGAQSSDERKSIGVCDAGIRDILQAFDIHSRLIDVSKTGLGPPILTEGSTGILQSKSVQALQHFHSRRNSSDAGSDSAFGDNLLENAVKLSFGRASSGCLDIDYEVVAQVQPDIILMSVPEESRSTKIQSHVREKICRASRRTAIIELASHSLADVLQHVLDIGDALHERDQAVAIVKKVRERLRKVVMYSQKAKLITPTIPAVPKIAILGSLHPLTVEGAWVRDLVELVGGKPLPTHGQTKRIISWDDLVAFAPDILVICAPIINSGDKSAKVFNDLCDIASQPGWWQLPAVRDGVVVICEEALLCRMGIRLIDGAEALTRIVYGDNVPTCCLPRSAFKLKLRPGQRVRPRLLPNYFMAYA